MARNDGISRPMAAEIIPGIPNPAGTGAGAGSQGASAAENPAPLAAVGIVPVYESSQAPLDVVTVNIGDTTSNSSDDPYFHGREPATGVVLGGTGAGQGSVVTPVHPSAAHGSGAGAP